jgi:iron-sulfur cluster assembly protein
MAMALDEPKDSDKVYDIGGFKYIVDKEFMKKAEPIKVDFFMDMGFKVSSGIDFGPQQQCGGCGSSKSCC